MGQARLSRPVNVMDFEREKELQRKTAVKKQQLYWAVTRAWHTYRRYGGLKKFEDLLNRAMISAGLAD